MLEEINISTKERYQLIDITDSVEKIVKESGIKEGAALILVLHTSAALLLTENEEGLRKDWLDFLKELVSNFDFRHDKLDNNADSHIIAGLIGEEKIFPIKDGQIVRGLWQQIFLLELDGPRNRKIIVKII